MSKFKLKKSTHTPEVSTASLPDIVFMLLFFFMTVTVMKDDTLKVVNELPNATEIKKLEKKNRIITIYIGKPVKKFEESQGNQLKIQMDDRFVNLADLGSKVLEAINERPEYIRGFITISLKVDKKASMGLIDDVKEELRKINALKINYTTYEGDTYKNLE
ncbi:biopolymer transporter ExbD [Maribacter algarum]|uniref:Biopolymer transporter ExbD n=1 Tax=Maribacter algarum (ex Zhang et al. 2020) TaxID=2578118 RepID=A0A5S3PTK6_9FLAO|nr:biopolymer transporter ExbD [Maribacter algarum]TMM58331.1 biopolymer transporter ExbD [Maribacter algarum]